MSGLVRKKISVRSKSGKTYQRSILGRAGDSAKKTAKRVGGFVSRHKGKIAGAAALAGAAYLGHKHGVGNLARAAAKVPEAHKAGVERGAKFHKVAVASGWAGGVSHKDWSHRTVRHAAKGYVQGFRKKMKG
jgi:hypothetical protein